MPNPRQADRDDDDPNGEDVLQDIATSGRNGGERQQRQANGHDGDNEDGEQFEFVEIDDGQAGGDQGNDRGGDQGQGRDHDDDDGRDSRLTEDEQESVSYLDQNDGGQSGRSKNVRRREARDRVNAENAALKARLAASETRMATLEHQMRSFRGTVEPQLAQFSKAQLQNRMATVEGQIAKADQDLETAEKAFISALSENDNDAALTAMKNREKMFIARGKLENEKERVANAISAGGGDGGDGDKGGGADNRQQRQTRERQPSPRADVYAEEFRRRFRWFSDGATDPKDVRDVGFVRVLDNTIMNEGYDPGDAAYWRELESRMRETLPHRFPKQQREREDNVRQNGNGQDRGNGERQAQPRNNNARRGPPTAAPGSGSRPGGKIRVAMTNDRREALFAGGYIDESGKPTDQARFNNIMRQYAEQDLARANGTAH